MKSGLDAMPLFLLDNLLMRKQNQTRNSTVKNKAYEVDTNIFFCCMYNIWNICAYLEVETKKQDAKMLYYLFYLDKYRSGLVFTRRNKKEMVYFRN